MKFRNTYHSLLKCNSFAVVAMVCVLFFGMAYKAAAQDIHFSQYYAAPSLLNPATTGNFTGKYRVGLNYRTQWSSVTVPWRTFDVYGDLSMLKERRERSHYIGLGMLLARDQAGDGALSTTKIMVNGAIHFKIDRKELHTFSLGIQAGLVQKNIDWTKLFFNNQWTDGGFDRTLPTRENYSTGKLMYPDLGIGMKYENATDRKLNYYGSLALNHLIRPKESFYAESANRVGVRTVFSAGASFKVAGGFAAAPSFQFMTQQNASEFVAGSMFAYDLSKFTPLRSKAFVGLYNRFGDALIPVVGGEYGPWRAFVSYDSNYSSLNVASRGYGAFELSLVYIGGLPKYKTLISVPCPRF